MAQSRRSLAMSGGDQPPRRFVLVLMDQFTLLPFTSAVEVLRIANRLAGAKLYDYVYASKDGLPVSCSAGITMQVDQGLVELDREDSVLICGGLHVAKATTKPLLNWIRREARRGVCVGGLCTGAHVLAAAGLLDGKRATIHWENADGFAEAFPEVIHERSVFTLEQGRMTAAGGTSSLDLMLRVVAQDHGPDLAAMVADQLIYTAIRSERDTQRLSVPARIGVRHPKLARVIEMMESRIEDPLSPAEAAQTVGLSARQLERLFARYLGQSPKRYYMDLRLAKARNLLMQTNMSVINVALASGFTSPSHFSKCYRARYQTTPYRERGTTSTGPKSQSVV